MTAFPVLFVHGIWDTGHIFEPLRRDLMAHGWTHVAAVDLVPANGACGIPVLAEQIRAAADTLLGESGSSRLDVVGFSMGALAVRYWLQKMGGDQVVRRFVSLSGPHRGSWWGWVGRHRGARDMRPGSALLKELEGGAWGDTQVYCLWTPFDLMVVPAQSGCLPGVPHEPVPVLLHGWMPKDPRVWAKVRRILTASGARTPL